MKDAVERRVGGNIPRRIDGRRTRSQRGSTSTGCWPLPRNGAAQSEILHGSREPEMKREQISERCAGLGRLPSAGSDGEIKRTGVRWLPAVARACLHIGFCKFSRRQNGAVQGVQVPPFELS